MDMSFFGIIFYLIIIVIFINAKKAAQSGNQQNKSGNRTTVSGEYSGKRIVASQGESKKSIADRPGDVRTSIQNVLETGSRAIPNVPEKGYTVKPNVPKTGRTAVPNVPVKKRKERRFMEPHREERVQPKIRNNNLWGEDEHAHQRIVALRLMEGDPVPEGYVKVKCPYCAAENLVTKHCKQYHSCYFCRVPID